MNNCSWYLWLRGRKIFNIRQLRENFDTPLLTGYFLGGSLMKWLSDIGEYDIIRRLSSVDKSGDIGRQLEFAFGVSPDPHDPLSEPEIPVPEPEISVPAESVGSSEIPVFTGSFYGVSSFGGLTESSFAAAFAGNIASSFAKLFTQSAESSFYAAFTGGAGSSFSSFSLSSFASIVGNAFASQFTSSFSSFNFSSYAAFVSGQALNIASSGFASSGSSFSFLFGQNWLNNGIYGSFSLSSFNFGSFSWLFGKYGNILGSSGGSFYGSFGLALMRLLALYGGSFGSFGSFGNIGEFFGEGSFRYNAAGVTITAEEYHRTLINLSSCPLNAYGYGINLV